MPLTERKKHRDGEDTKKIKKNNQHEVQLRTTVDEVDKVDEVAKRENR